MSGSPKWVSVQDAMILAGKSKSAIYRWVDAGTVRSRRSAAGQKEILGIDVLQAEAQTRMGRPRARAVSKTLDSSSARNVTYEGP